MFEFLRIALFQVLLILGIGQYLVQLGFAMLLGVVKRHQVLLVTSFFCLGILIQVFLTNRPPNKQTTLEEPLGSPALIAERLMAREMTIREMTTEEAIALLEKYQEKIELGGVGRDTLINAALLSEQLGEHAKSKSYLQAAQKLDPNHEYFKKM